MVTLEDDCVAATAATKEDSSLRFERSSDVCGLELEELAPLDLVVTFCVVEDDLDVPSILDTFLGLPTGLGDELFLMVGELLLLTPDVKWLNKVSTVADTLAGFEVTDILDAVEEPFDDIPALVCPDVDCLELV